MGKTKAPSIKSKYFIPKEPFYTVLHFSMTYPLWLAEYKTSADTAKAIVYDKERVQTSNQYDSTQDTAIKLAEIKSNIDMIDKTISEVSDGQDYYIRLSVCYGLTYWQLRSKGMPLNKNEYGEMRQHFYFLLARKLNLWN